VAQDGSTSAHPAARPVWWAGVGPMTAAVMRAWRRVPFTTAVVAVMLAVAVGTGGLWDSVQDRSWYSVVAYGVPSLRAGRWWTPVTGSFLAATPLANWGASMST